MNIIFKGVVGSQAYGTSTPTSDIDIKGVYIQPLKEVLGFSYSPQIEVTKDECYFEVKRFLELLSTANPTMLELLFLPEKCVKITTGTFELIKQQRDLFVTKKCLNSFGGYAIQQIQKAKGLNKKMNWEKEEMQRKTPLDFCYFYTTGHEAMPMTRYLQVMGFKQEYCGLVPIDHIRDGYALYYDWRGSEEQAEPIGFKGIQLGDSNSIRSSDPTGIITGTYGFIHYNKDGYTQHCKKYGEYETWLTNRNTERYVETEEHGQKIDGKNLMHCCRLIDMAIEIAKYGKVVVQRANADKLLAIRRGEIPLETLLLRSEERIQGLNELYAKSSLPDSVDTKKVEELLIKIRTQR